jgi:hypothetical protein
LKYSYEEETGEELEMDAIIAAINDVKRLSAFKSDEL